MAKYQQKANEGKADQYFKEGNPGVNRVYNMALMRHRFYVIQFKRLMRVIFSLFFIPSFSLRNGINTSKLGSKLHLMGNNSQKLGLKWDK